MRANIVCVGKIKERYFSQAIDEYRKRLSRFCETQVYEVKETLFKGEPNSKQVSVILEEEGKRIEDKLAGYCAATDIDGKIVTSEQLSEMIVKAKNTCGEITFVIGGSYGLSRSVKERCDQRISFGKITYPHQLMRVILFEQLYRGFMIAGGGSYHK